MKPTKLIITIVLFSIVAANSARSEEPNPYAEYRTKTYDIQQEYLQRITQHQAEVMRDMEHKLKQQQWQTNAIAIMVFIMVSIGLFLSFLQFRQDVKQGGKSSFSFKFGAGSFEINSAVIGLAIMAMSFWFFQTYIDRVYSVAKKFRTPIFLSKPLHSQNIRDGCPSFYFLLNLDISPPFQPHHYLPLPHIRHPINTSINTIPGSQTQ